MNRSQEGQARLAAWARRAGLVAAMLLLTSGAGAQAQEVDKERLRSLVPFPRALLRRMSLSIGLGYAPSGGAAFFWDARDTAPDLANARQSPKSDWQRWTAQGQRWGERAWRSRQTAKSPAETGPLAATPAAATNLMPMGTETQRLWKQAFACFDRAVALAPRQPLPYALRGYYAGRYAMARSGSGARNQLAGLSDYERAARLDSRNPYLIALAAWFAYTEWGIRHFKNENYDNFAVWKAMPDAQRQAMRAWRGRLEKLTRDPDRQIAARAYTALAWLEYEFHDVPPSQPQSHLRRALALNPRLREAAQLLMHTFAIEDEWPSLAAFCMAQAGREASVSPDQRARFTLLAAYAYEKAGQNDTAMAQAALAMQPSGDVAACLTFAALCLKHSDRADNLQRAGELLDRCETLLNTPQARPRPEDRADVTLLRGLYLALNGHLPEARQQIIRLLQTEPDNEPAKRIQQALAATASATHTPGW